jgi:hypothetical protein
MSLEGAIVYRMKTFNLNSDEWDGTRDRDAGASKARLSASASVVSSSARPCPKSRQAEFRELWEEFETPNGAARQVVPHLRGRADATKLPASAMVMA